MATVTNHDCPIECDAVFDARRSADEACRAADEAREAADEQFCAMFQPTITRIVRRTLQRSGLDSHCDDAIQEVICSFIVERRIDRFERRAAFCHFVNVVAKREALNYVRRATRLRDARTKNLPDLIDDLVARPTISHETLECIETELGKLSDQDRMIWEDVVEQVPRAETAAKVGISERALFKKIASIRSRLKKCVEVK